jgi:hypothetical protein
VGVSTTMCLRAHFAGAPPPASHPPLAEAIGSAPLLATRTSSRCMQQIDATPAPKWPRRVHPGRRAASPTRSSPRWTPESRPCLAIELSRRTGRPERSERAPRSRHATRFAHRQAGPSRSPRPGAGGGWDAGGGAPAKCARRHIVRETPTRSSLTRDHIEADECRGHTSRGGAAGARDPPHPPPGRRRCPSPASPPTRQSPPGRHASAHASSNRAPTPQYRATSRPLRGGSPPRARPGDPVCPRRRFATLPACRDRSSRWCSR